MIDDLTGREARAADAGLTLRVPEGGHHNVSELVHVPLADDPGQLVPSLSHLLINPGPAQVNHQGECLFGSESSLVYRLLADLLPHQIADDASNDRRPMIGQYGSLDMGYDWSTYPTAPPSLLPISDPP